jgi:hypothetical protein
MFIGNIFLDYEKVVKNCICVIIFLVVDLNL